MKTRIALTLLTLVLAACQQPAPRAYGVKPYGTISQGNRYTATWGGPLVTWIDHTNGHRWTCSYKDFFAYCGGKHPSALGISVKGKLPANLAKPQPAATTQISTEPPADTEQQDPICTDNPATYQPVYSTPQNQQ